MYIQGTSLRSPMMYDASEFLAGFGIDVFLCGEVRSKKCATLVRDGYFSPSIDGYDKSYGEEFGQASVLLLFNTKATNAEAFSLIQFYSFCITIKIKTPQWRSVL
ncbi:MAG: hypothetical protein Q9M09_05475 [Mariprofundaceae bacterium]|nr:hypothetical protein [Mariprofundaceae bacterium]